MNNDIDKDILNSSLDDDNILKKKNTKSKNKKNKKNISLITAILLVTTILSVAVNVFLLVTDHKRTQSTVARIEAVDIDAAKAAERENMLNTIRSQFENGSSTLAVLKQLYPDNIVYANRSGNYVFADINPSLAKTEYSTGNFSRDANGFMTYSDENATKTYTGIDLSRYNSDVDFAKAKASGIDYAMIRCGYRAYGSGLLVKDTSFETYITSALTNNVDVGVYFYTQAV